MTEPIRGKVARILNAQELAINVGIAHGVNVGMYFDVMDAQGQDIKDPDTNEVLGSFERPKVRLKITHVQDKFSVASTYKSKRLNLGGIGIYPALGFGPIARSLMPPSWVTKHETLEKTGETPNELKESESTVKTGDPVVQVIDVDELEQKDTNEK